MAFTATVSERTVEGNNRVVRGSYVNTGGSTGGEVVTGLSVVKDFSLQPLGAAVATNASVVNETLPLVNSTGSVTIVTDADQSGTFQAVGL